MSCVTESGERDLEILLSSLTAILHEPIFVFATTNISPGKGEPSLLQELLPLAQMIYREAEGFTLILPREVAEARSLEYTFPSRMVTLNVHSSLTAVGFLAVITDRLKAANMPVNPVSAFYHDHLFVPNGREMEVLYILESIAADAKNKQ